jgi:hypothetical protein
MSSTPAGARIKPQPLGYKQRLSHLIHCGQSRVRSSDWRWRPICLSGSRWLRLVLAIALVAAAACAQRPAEPFDSGNVERLDTGMKLDGGTIAVINTVCGW